MEGFSTFKEQPPQHQVFISSHGDERSSRFVSNLVSDLIRHNINICTYWGVGNNGQRTKLFERMIEKSRIALVIFSGRCTESTWCLRELKEIADRVEKGQLVAIPIFYNLDLSTVESLRGQFGETLRGLIESDETKRMRKKALMSITKRVGIVVDKERLERAGSDEFSEFTVIQTIVKKIKIALKEISSERSQNASYVEPWERTQQTFGIIQLFTELREKLDHSISDLGKAMIMGDSFVLSQWQ